MQIHETRIDSLADIPGPLPSLLSNEPHHYREEMVTPYHEAAHSMLLMSQGVYPNMATLDPPFVHIEYHLELNAEESLMMFMAGCIAEGFLIGRYKGYDLDIERINEILAENYYSLDALIKVWRKTHDILADNWQTVNYIAEDLKEYKQLNKEYFKRYDLF